MNKRLIRLTEQDLHRIVKESVKRVLKEDNSGSYTIPQHEFNGSLKNLTYSRKMAKQAYEAIEKGNIEEASHMIITVYNDLYGEIKHMMDTFSLCKDKTFFSESQQITFFISYP